jgi:hypothetical protein
MQARRCPPQGDLQLLSQPEVLGAILPQLANPQPDGIFAKDN